MSQTKSAIDIHSKTIFIPRNIVSYIVGRGGCRIKNMCKISNCKISLKKSLTTRTLSSSTHIPVPTLLQGSFQAIEEAQKLINDAILNFYENSSIRLACTVYVRNIESDTSLVVFNKQMSKVGSVVRSNLTKPRNGTKAGFVEFNTPDIAEKVIMLLPEKPFFENFKPWAGLKWKASYAKQVIASKTPQQFSRESTSKLHRQVKLSECANDLSDNKIICRDYVRGKCRRNRCKFLHESKTSSFENTNDIMCNTSYKLEELNKRMFSNTKRKRVIKKNEEPDRQRKNPKHSQKEYFS